MEESVKPLLGLEADSKLNKLKSERKAEIAKAKAEAKAEAKAKAKAKTKAKTKAIQEESISVATPPLAIDEPVGYMGILGKYVDSKSDAIKDYTVEQLKEFLRDIERAGWIKDNMISYVVDNKLIDKSIAKPLVEQLSRELIDQYKGQLKESANFLLRTKLPDEISKAQKDHDVAFQKYEKANIEIDRLNKTRAEYQEKYKETKVASGKKALTEEISKINRSIGVATQKRNKFEEEYKTNRGKKNEMLDMLNLTGKGIIRRKSRAKAKAKSKSVKREMAITPQPTILQTMPPTGLQPQQYRQQLTATTITPQMTQ